MAILIWIGFSHSASNVHNQLAFGDKYLAEQFILARYFAYWQIYLHKTTRRIESLMKSVWRRKTSLHGKTTGVCPTTIEPFLGERAATFQDYFNVDDWILYLPLSAGLTQMIRSLKIYHHVSYNVNFLNP